MLSANCNCENGSARFGLDSKKGKWQVDIYYHFDKETRKCEKEKHRSFWLYKNAVRFYERMLKKYDLH